MPSQVLDLFYVQTDLKQSGNIGMTKDMGSYMTVRQLVLNQSPETPVRTCLKPSNVVLVQKNHLNGSIPVCNISGCYGYGMRQSHCIYDNVALDSLPSSLEDFKQVLRQIGADVKSYAI